MKFKTNSKNPSNATCPNRPNQFSTGISPTHHRLFDRIFADHADSSRTAKVCKRQTTTTIISLARKVFRQSAARVDDDTSFFFFRLFKSLRRAKKVRFAIIRSADRVAAGNGCGGPTLAEDIP